MSDTRRYTQVTKAVYERPWAIQPGMLAVIEEVVRLRASGSPLSADQIEKRVAAATTGPRQGGQQAQGVAVIPIYGVIAPKANLMSEMSGATTVESLMSTFRAAMADPDIGAIVFDVDSPGGSVEGITEAAAEIRAARGHKPMAAVSNTLMASAAYWLASQADEVIASPSAMVGSVGIIAAHLDQSKADEQAGESYTFVTAGEGKANGNAHEPLSDDARDEIQADVDDFYALFTADVAAGRGVPVDRISGEWKASTFTARKAVAAGLADRVDTLDATVSRMLVQANTRSGAGRYAHAADYQHAGMDAAATVAGALAAVPISEQLAIVNAEGERIAAHYAKRAELRAKEGRALPATTEEQIAALASLGTIPREPDDPDIDTDQPEDAEPPAATDWRGRARFDVLEAAVRGGYPLPPNEVAPS